MSEKGEARSEKADVVALIAAAGSADRFGGDKIYKKLPSGESPLEKSLKTFCAHAGVDAVMVAINPNDRSAYGRLTAASPPKLLPACEGGGTRGESVANCIRSLTATPKYILVHDAARPFASAELISRVIGALGEGNEVVVPAVAVADTLRRAVGGYAEKTVDRRNLFAAQTPQGFEFATLLKAVKPPFAYTDEAAAAEAIGARTALVKGQADNIKITDKQDWSLAAALDSRAAIEPRSGYGFDVHRLIGGKAMTLCGVRIVGKHMLAGHSDADVAVHALTDAILGALALGDIGSHFPSTDAKWKNADSLQFLRFAVGKVAEYRGRITSVDITLVCESPRITPLRAQMVKKLGEVLGVEPSRIGVKATTTEGLGFTGRAEGIAAHALVSLLLPGTATENAATQS